MPALPAPLDGFSARSIEAAQPQKNGELNRPAAGKGRRRIETACTCFSYLGVKMTRTDWCLREWLILGGCILAIPLLLLVWNLIHFAYAGLILQMLPPEMVRTPPSAVATAATGKAGASAAPAPAEADAPASPAPGSTSSEEDFVLLAAPTWRMFYTDVICGLVLYGVFVRPAVALAGRYLTPLAVSPGDPDCELRIIRRLRIRALWVRAGALLTILVIMGLLVVGLLIFVAADRLAAGLGHMEAVTIASSLGARVGAVLILFFLVKLLVVMYRYNARLAGFYDSRADAMQLCGKRPAELKKLANLLYPRIAFDEVPKTPLEESVAAATAALGAVKKGAETVKELRDGAAKASTAPRETRRRRCRARHRDGQGFA
jgi:hypothetical protein